MVSYVLFKLTVKLYNGPLVYIHPLANYAHYPFEHTFLITLFRKIVLTVTVATLPALLLRLFARIKGRNPLLRPFSVSVGGSSNRSSGELSVYGNSTFSMSSTDDTHDRSEDEESNILAA